MLSPSVTGSFDLSWNNQTIKGKFNILFMPDTVEIVKLVLFGSYL